MVAKTFESVQFNSTLGTTSRDEADRWSDVINVLDFGADPTNVNDSTANIQAAVDALQSSALNGQRGKIFIPPGTYKISSPGIQLPQNTGLTAETPSLIIEGASASNAHGVTSTASGLIASPAFNGFILDDLNTTISGTHSGGSPWAVRDLSIKNVYVPPLIYKEGVLCAGAWNRGAATITVTNASGGNNILEGAVLFDRSTFADITGYLGFVASGGVAVGGTNTVLTLGDGAAPSVGLAGAQLPSGTAASPGTKTNDALFVVQGFFAAASFSVGATTITMASSNPGLDAGLYYVLNWTAVTAGRNVMPTCLGVVSSANWVGTTLTLNNPLVNAASVGSADLLVLTPCSGAIRHTNTIDATVDNCLLTGIIGAQFECTGLNPVDTGNASQITIGASIRNCAINNPRSNSDFVGSIGVYSGQSTLVQNCDIGAEWNGIRLQGANPMVMGGRTETCAYGIVLGGLLNAPASSGNASAFLICNTEAEGSWVANIATDITSTASGTINSVISTNQHQNACYGYYFRQITGLTVISCSVSSTISGVYGGYVNPSFKGLGTPTGIYIGGNAPTEPNFSAFIGVTSISQFGSFWVSEATAGRMTTSPITQAWRLSGSPTSARFIGCNNSPLIFTFANLPAAKPVTGQISIDGSGAGGNGNLLQFTAGASFSPMMQVGSLISGAGVAAGTTNTGRTVSGINQITTVSGSAQTVAAGSAMTYYPMIEGDEYLISDSPVSASPTFAAGASWTTTSTAITMGATLPGVVVGGQTVFNDNTNKNVGTVDPASSGTNLLLTTTATSSSSGSADVLIFNPVSNYGAAVITGGGTYTVKVRWSAKRQNWLLA